MYIDRYTCMQPYDHGVMQGTLLEDAMAESPEELLVAKMMWGLSHFKHPQPPPPLENTRIFLDVRLNVQVGFMSNFNFGVHLVVHWVQVHVSSKKLHVPTLETGDDWSILKVLGPWFVFF